MPAIPNNPPLVILLHGYAHSKKKYDSLIRTLQDIYGCKEVLFPELALSLFATVKPNQLVLKIIATIDRAWTKIRLEEQRTPAIILIGHSTGALLARKVYVTACGENLDAPFEPELAGSPLLPWAAFVERIILLAGINRGWTINPRISLPKTIAMIFGIQAGKLMAKLGYPPLAFETKRGAPFITQLRIQSLMMHRQADKKGVGDALTIQLLGTKDDLISPDDNVDLVTGHRFIYLDMPISDHTNVIDMNGTKGKKRAVFLQEVLQLPEQDLRKISVPTSDEGLLHQDNTVTDVVFVIHGIRDTGFWTHKIARKVKLLGDNTEGKKYATETSTYGYFAMLSFLRYGARRAKVEWLMDKYTENMAIYPKAEFSFVGHSNGTYLLAKALKEYPACHFKNVLLAGSVVRQDYNWKELLAAGRIKNMYNIVATADWVVGIFPRTLQTLQLQDLGSGGFDGFLNLEESAQFKCIKGDHGAGVEENVWDEIAHFIVHGKPLGSTLQKKERPLYMKILAAMGPFIFMAGVLLLIVGGIKLYSIIPDPSWRIIGMGCYAYIVWKCLTWF